MLTLGNNVLQAIDEKIRELSNCHVVYSGIEIQKVLLNPITAYLFVFVHANPMHTNHNSRKQTVMHVCIEKLVFIFEWA